MSGSRSYGCDPVDRALASVHRAHRESICGSAVQGVVMVLTLTVLEPRVCSAVSRFSSHFGAVARLWFSWHSRDRYAVQLTTRGLVTWLPNYSCAACAPP